MSRPQRYFTNSTCHFKNLSNSFWAEPQERSQETESIAIWCRSKPDMLLGQRRQRRDLSRFCLTVSRACNHSILYDILHKRPYGPHWVEWAVFSHFLVDYLFRSGTISLCWWPVSFLIIMLGVVWPAWGLCRRPSHGSKIYNSANLWSLLLEPQAQIQKIAKNPSGSHLNRNTSCLKSTWLQTVGNQDLR